MAHLAEVHIREGLEHSAEDIRLRAVMLQSHLESTATVLLQLKFILTSKTSTSTPSEKEENFYMQISSQFDSLISQARTAKVVSSKTVRQLEELKSRCLTLDSSTTPTIEVTEQSGVDVFSSAVQMGRIVLKLFVDGGETGNITTQAISTTLKSGQSSISSLGSKLQATTHHLHSFYDLTINLSQAVEFQTPPSDPPWKLLAQRMKAADADLAAREVEMSQLKDEIAEKNTTLAMKEKIAGEMGVKLEVLEKRVNDSTGRRERVKELEEASVSAKAKERDLLQKLTRLQSELQQAEAEREKWKTSAQTESPPVTSGQPSTVGISSQIGTSQSSLQQISYLKSEIKTLQSCIRYLRTAAHTQSISNSLDFLSNPITPAAPSLPTAATEAKSVLKEMLNLIDQPHNRPVKLQPSSATERTRWRPAKDTTTWQVQRQREEWEEWREWRDGVAKKAALARRQRERVAASKAAGNLRGGHRSEMQMQLPGKISSGKGLKIVDPSEWDKVQQTLGGLAR